MASNALQYLNTVGRSGRSGNSTRRDATANMRTGKRVAIIFNMFSLGPKPDIQ
jgi:hypothetical protein